MARPQFLLLVMTFILVSVMVIVLCVKAQGRESYPAYNRNGTYGGYYQTNPYNGTISAYSVQNRYSGRLSPSTQGYNQYAPLGGFGGQIRTDRNLHRNRW